MTSPNRRKILFGRERPLSEDYYLYDKFITDRISGAVNGTQAEPVGGVREGFDSNGKFSISGGRLVNITGSATYNGFRWPQQTRQLGLSLLCESVVTTFGQHIGWDTLANTQASFLYDGIIAAPTILYVFVSQAVIAVGESALSTSYQTCTTQRASGHFYFVKGGIYSNWTLVYTSAVGTYNGLPRIASPNAGANNYDNIRVPKQTYIPVPLQSDGMSAATTDGLGNPENNGVAGNAYVDIGTWGVTGGKRACSVLSGTGFGISLLPTPTRNVVLECDITRTASSAGIVVRYTDDDNLIKCLHNGTNVIVSRHVAGVITTLSTTAVAYSAGAKMVFISDGLTYRAFYNNTAAGSGVLPDTNGTSHGVITNNINATFDNLVIWPRGNEGQHEALSQM